MARARSTWPGRASHAGNARGSAPPGAKTCAVRSASVTGALLLERGDELQVDLAFKRRPSGLETIVDTDEPAGRLEPQPEADAVVLLGFEMIRHAQRVGEPRRGPGVVPEQERALGVGPEEPTILESREHVAVDAERVLVETAQRRRAAQRVAFEHR